MDYQDGTFGRRKQRINDFGMTTMDVVATLSDGNPGAVDVLCRLLNEGPTIDPDCALGGLANLLDLDSHGIYGSRIWMFYKNVCKQDLIRMVGLLRAVQLGLLEGHKLHSAIDNYGVGLDIPALIAQVKERLPRFAHQNKQ